MKKTAKTLLGVLSIGALVGTGYAMWHVSGGFVGAETELTPGIETEVDKNFGLIEVTPLDGDNTINFDGVLDEDLTVKYTVKALANEGSSRDPYDLTNYDGVAEEYIPNLKITTIAKDDVGELSVDDEFFNYVKLPEVQVVDYKTWLDSTCKDNGYAVTLTFSWSDELDNQNPELAWKGLTVEEQEANFNSLIKALEGVKFTFKFEVGNKVDEPTVDETSEITLPTVEGSTLTIEGMKEGTISAGTHAVTLEVTEENKVLKDSKVFVTYSDAEGIVGNDELILTAQNSRAIYETYVGEYTFKANFKYSFSYELVDNVPESEIKTFYFKDKKGLNTYGSTAYLYAWKSTEVNKDWPGVELTQLSWNIFDDEANIYVGEIDIAKYDSFIFSTSLEGQTRDISISELGDNNFIIMTDSLGGNKYEVQFADYDTEMKKKEATINMSYNSDEGTVEYENKTYYNNYEFVFTVSPVEGYIVSQVLFNSVSLEITEDNVYTVSLESGINNIEISFVSTAIKTGTISFVENSNVNVTAYIGQEVYDNSELAVGTEVTLKIDTITPDYVVNEVRVNDLAIVTSDGVYKFKVVENINKVEIIGEVVSSPFSNPNVVSPSEIANTELRENTYFETSCIVKSFRSGGFVITDSNNFDLSIDCNLFYSSEEKFINNVEYNAETGQYKVKSSQESSDNFDVDSFDVGDLVKIRGFTNSTGFFKGYLVEKVSDASEIKYGININCPAEGSAIIEEGITEAPINTTITLNVSVPEGKRISSVTFNGELVEANIDDKYVINTAFTNNIEINFVDDGVVTFNQVSIGTNVLKPTTYDAVVTSNIEIYDSNGTTYNVEFQVKGYPSSGYQFNKNKGGCFIKNTTPLPAPIDRIEIQGFNKGESYSTYLVYSTSQEVIESVDVSCESATLAPIGENDVYFNISHNETGGACAFTSITIYFK